MKIAHELWAAAQLVPGECIVDGLARIEEILKEAEPVACVDSGVLNWIADAQINGPADLYATSPTHRVVSVEFLNLMSDLISSVRLDIHNTEARKTVDNVSIALRRVCL